MWLRLWKYRIISLKRASCIKTENELKSPYWEFTEAYIGVIIDGNRYSYFWISSDSSGQGIKELTPIDMLDIDNMYVMKIVIYILMLKWLNKR